MTTNLNNFQLYKLYELSTNNAYFLSQNLMSQKMIEGKVLGKQISHPREYSPEILVAVPRQLNRDQYNITGNDLPFVGFDAWHAYELGFLTENGLPVVGVLKLVYACDNEFLVESKSLKLYLNSFNMGKYGVNRKDGIEKVLSVIKSDLSQLLKTDVNVSFHSSYNQNVFDFGQFELLEEGEFTDSIQFETYKECPDFLISEKTERFNNYHLATHLLRSNCKITHQPDWGSAYIYIKTKHEINKSGLLKYLVSIRDENHFHEEICEMLYKRLVDEFEPEELMVSCLYTRRGGIDICPVRATSSSCLPENIIQASVLTQPSFRQ